MSRLTAICVRIINSVIWYKIHFIIIYFVPTIWAIVFWKTRHINLSKLSTYWKINKQTSFFLSKNPIWKILLCFSKLIYFLSHIYSHTLAHTHTHTHTLSDNTNILLNFILWMVKLLIPTHRQYNLKQSRTISNLSDLTFSH